MLTATAAKTAAAKAVSKNIAELTENIIHVHTVAAKTTSTTTFKGLVPITVIFGPLVFIAQNLVSFCRFFEQVFRLVISRVFIRVMLYCLFSISLFDLGCSCILAYS